MKKRSSLETDVSGKGVPQNAAPPKMTGDGQGRTAKETWAKSASEAQKAIVKPRIPGMW